MKSTKWIKIFFGLSLIGVLFVGGVNYIVDPYGINNRIIIDKINLKKYSNTSITARFKLNILNNKNIETIMLGTSRIGVMNPMIVDKYLKILRILEGVNYEENIFYDYFYIWINVCR